MKEVKLRKYENKLIISGLGVILFGIWSVVKSLLSFILNMNTDESYNVSMLVNVLIFLAIELALRLYIGMSARSEGFGRKKRYAYIVLSVIISILSFVSLLYLLYANNIESLLQYLVSILFEATSMFAYIELVVSAFAVKKLRKEIG